MYDRLFSILKLKGISIKINHRKILAGIAQLIGVKSQLSDFTVALDKLGKIGDRAVINELLQKGFEQKVIDKLKPFLSSKSDFKSKLSKIEVSLSGIEVSNEGIEELKFIHHQLAEKSLKAVTLDLDFALARGLNYYTGLILEVMPLAILKLVPLEEEGDMMTLLICLDLKIRVDLEYHLGSIEFYSIGGAEFISR